MGFEIRRADVGDAEAIAVLNRVLGRADGVEEVRESLSRLCTNGRDVILIAASHDGTALGWIHAGEREVLGSGRRCEILGLVVGEEARGRGVGRRLVAGAEEWATAGGLSEVVVRSNTRRLDSHPFYERLGYTRMKTQHVYRKSGS